MLFVHDITIVRYEVMSHLVRTAHWVVLMIQSSDLLPCYDFLPTAVQIQAKMPFSNPGLTIHRLARQTDLLMTQQVQILKTNTGCPIFVISREELFLGVETMFNYFCSILSKFTWTKTATVLT